MKIVQSQLLPKLGAFVKSALDKQVTHQGFPEKKLEDLINRHFNNPDRPPLGLVEGRHRRTYFSTRFNLKIGEAGEYTVVFTVAALLEREDAEITPAGQRLVIKW